MCAQITWDLLAADSGSAGPAWAREPEFRPHLQVMGPTERQRPEAEPRLQRGGRPVRPRPPLRPAPRTARRGRCDDPAPAPSRAPPGMAGALPRSWSHPSAPAAAWPPRGSAGPPRAPGPLPGSRIPATHGPLATGPRPGSVRGAWWMQRPTPPRPPRARATGNFGVSAVGLPRFPMPLTWAKGGHRGMLGVVVRTLAAGIARA